MEAGKFDVPKQVEDRIMHTHDNDEGQIVLSDTMDKLNKLEKDWNFNPLEVLGGESSLLVKVENPSAEHDTVVKIPADSSSGRDEIAALKIWEDCNVPTVKQEDPSTGSFMMEYVENTSERTVTPFQAFVLADIIHTPAANFDYEFPSLLSSMVQRLVTADKRKGQDDGPAPDDFELAVQVVEMLLATQDHEELLHGDYRNQNIIYAYDGPIVIDPHPCVGDSLFDIASWLADTDTPDDVGVVSELVGSYADRLVPWVWALSIINDRTPDAPARVTAIEFREQAERWLMRQKSRFSI